MNEAGEHIDHQHLEKYVSGDSMLRDEILEIFVEQVAALIERFDVLQHDSDWKDVAHTLKGASRGVGAWALGDLGATAEELVGASPGKAEARATLLVSIRHQARQVIDEAMRSRTAALAS
ncbi:MAG: Hpt domain-containing protein [Parvularculaceae bacterium]